MSKWRRLAAARSPEPKSPSESIKETVDSIIVAFCLAFVFRAFVVEAFVIPTGSMAGTLLGEHRSFACTDCGYRYEVGLDTPRPGQTVEPPDLQMRNKVLRCPSCGWVLEQPKRMAEHSPNCGGDKILVLKFPYLFREPRRWDVVVFYNPANPDENYIKRLVGLPGETLRILDGDVFVKAPDRHHYQIARKPDTVQEAVWRPIHLRDYLPKRMAQSPAGPRDRQYPAWVHDADSGWSDSPDRREFRFTAAPGANGRLAYVPGSPSEAADAPNGFNDYSSYNGYLSALLDTVWDVRLDFVVFFDKAGGVVRASTTNRRQERLTATIGQNGRVELRMDRELGGEPLMLRSWQRSDPFALGEGTAVRLQNVDYRAGVWIAGRQVVATTDDEYYPNINELIGPESDRRGESGPDIWINAEQADLRVRHIALYRDIYYTARLAGSDRALRGIPDSAEPEVELNGPTEGRPKSDIDEFFVLGDNSPKSADGRVWEWTPRTSWHLVERYHEGLYRPGRVPRDHLIGQAFFVYWPAGLTAYGSNLRLVPNVGRMRLIH